jgi:hypothetical protein
VIGNSRATGKALFRAAGPRSRIVFLCVALLSVLLISRSLYVIYTNYFIPLYLDEWEFVIWNFKDHSFIEKIKFIFYHHCEHLIATTNIVFFLDYYLFQLAKWQIVLLTCVVNIILYFILTKLLFGSHKALFAFVVTGLVFSVAALSLAQWETFLWAFEIQLSLSLLGAVVSILITLKAAKDDFRGVFWATALFLAIGFSVFSMADGLFAALAVVALLLILRAPLRAYISPFIAEIIYGWLYVALPLRTPQIGDLALRTPLNITKFFFTTLGAPFTKSVDVACAIGALFFFAQSYAFVFLIIRPWVKRQAIDENIAALFSLSGFLLVSMAAASFNRCTFGADAAMAPRYQTVTLYLWMTFFAIMARRELNSSNIRGLQTCLLGAFAFGAWSTLRPSALADVYIMHQRITESAYFVASDALATEKLRALFPKTGEIIAPLQFMRDRHLNIFAISGGLPMPSDEEIANVVKAKALPFCSTGTVDVLTKLDHESWLASGWASDSQRRSPKWIFAMAQNKTLLGFTTPMVMRPDVEAFLKAPVRGFNLPIHSKEINRSDVPIIVVVPRDHGSPCRVNFPDKLYGASASR